MYKMQLQGECWHSIFPESPCVNYLRVRWFQSVLRYDKFDSISLHLPEPNDVNAHTLNNLLSNFVKNELIHDITCEGCNKNRAPNTEPITAPAIKLLRFAKVLQAYSFSAAATHTFVCVLIIMLSHSYQRVCVFILFAHLFMSTVYTNVKITQIFPNTLLCTRMCINRERTTLL